jgi:hypothetical protein
MATRSIYEFATLSNRPLPVPSNLRAPLRENRHTYLRNEVWFNKYLPSLQHLSPLSRLTGILLDNNVTLEEFHQHSSSVHWHALVKKAILERANHWYTGSASYADHSQRLPNFEFQYRGREYLRAALLHELAPIAIQARADRLPGVPQAWLHNPCPFCECEDGMNGAHLLQCTSLPTGLATSRDQLRGSLSVRAFAVQVVTCDVTPLVKGALPFAQKVFKTARKAVQDSTPPSSPESDAAAEQFLT